MRHLQRLKDERFDLLVIGAGAFGAFAAWDAALRGLKVALIDKGDYGGGVSSRCFRMVHGGIRYLQHLDLGRVRASCAERTAFLRICPHHVAPLPIVIPTYGMAQGSRWFLGAGSLVYDALTFDRNRHIAAPERRIPLTRFLGRQEVIDKFPFLVDTQTSGAVEFCDGQMHNPARLLLSVVKSAAAHQVAVANYCAAEEVLVTSGRAIGVRARDELTGQDFDIRAACILNTAGPAVGPLLSRSGLASGQRTGPFSRDACLLVDRPAPPRAIAIQGQTRDLDAILGRGRRHLFMVPWNGKTLIGVWHRVFRTPSEDISISRTELEAWLHEVNESCPGMNLAVKDVLAWDYGLVPFGEGSDPDSSDLRFGHESVFLDHETLDGVTNILSLIGIRYTMGRGDGERGVDWAIRKLGRQAPACSSHSTPIHGGDIRDIAMLAREITARAERLGVADRANALLRDHGTKYDIVLNDIEADPSLARRCGDSAVTAAEILHAVRHEAAQSLADVVLRRTDLGAAGCPSDASLTACAELLAREHGWSNGDIEREILAVCSFYPDFDSSPMKSLNFENQQATA